MKEQMQGLATSVEVMLELLGHKDLEVKFSNNMLYVFMDEKVIGRSKKYQKRKVMLIYPYGNTYLLQVNTKYADDFFDVIKALDEFVSVHPWSITKDSPLPQGGYLNYQYKIRSDELAKNMLTTVINHLTREEI